jgi:hypothetical protein
MDVRTREELAAEGKLSIVPEPFRLFWVWHNDGWHLAKSNGSNFTVFMPVDFQISNVVQGPFAAEIPAAPASKPVYIELQKLTRCEFRFGDEAGRKQCVLTSGHRCQHEPAPKL